MSEPLNGTLQTILIVDDDPTVLQMVSVIMQEAHYRVLQAKSGAEAIAVAGKTAGKIDLLLSDVDMPEMSGPDLGEELKKTRGDIRVMLMSGGGAEGNLLILNYGWAFIHKPFLKTKLIEMVSNVLRSENRSQPGGQEFDTRKDVARKT